MGAPGITPEAGDASASIVSRRKKHPRIIRIGTWGNNVFSHCPLLNLSKGTSVSIITAALNNHIALVESGILRCKASKPPALCTDDSGFPYYRSCKSFQDAVLVKDVGVSCTLLDLKSESRDTSTISTLERYLLNQLKVEYNDLSAITRKISVYTKDILQSLTLKNGKKNRSFGKMDCIKQPVAMQYTDKSGKPYLKLRLRESVPFAFTQETVPAVIQSPKGSCSQQEEDAAKYTQNIRVLTDTMRVSEEDNKLQKPPALTTRENETVSLQHVERAERIFPEESKNLEVESSTHSSSSIYNFLMMGKRRVSIKEASKQPTSMHVDPLPCQRKPKKNPRNTIRHLETSESPTINDRSDFSSKEIYFENNALKTTANFSTNFLRKEEKKMFKAQYKHSSTEERKGMHCSTAVANKWLLDRNLHTVNIRIVRRKRTEL